MSGAKKQMVIITERLCIGGIQGKHMHLNTMNFKNVYGPLCYTGCKLHF